MNRIHRVKSTHLTYSSHKNKSLNTICKSAHIRKRFPIYEIFSHLKRPNFHRTSIFPKGNRGRSTTADWCWRAVTTGTSEWSISTRISRYIHMLHSRWRSHDRWKSNGIWWTRHAGASLFTNKSKPLCSQLYKCSNSRRKREHDKSSLYMQEMTCSQSRNEKNIEVKVRKIIPST